LISLAPGTKVYLACRPVDLRNGFDGLAAKAQQMIGGAITSRGFIGMAAACG
jgi:transposase